MSDHSNNENTGKLIKPSGRSSIHNHTGCPFKKEVTMGRYGLTQNNDEVETHFNEDFNSIDDVDNSMSKHAHPIQIPSKHINKSQRSRSLGLLNEDFTSDRDILSKSLPTAFPQKPFYSDDSTSSSEESTQAYLSLNQSNNESWTDYETSQISTNRFCHISEKPYAYLWLLAAVVVIVGIIFKFDDIKSIYHNDEKMIVPSEYYKIKLYDDLSSLGEKYRVNDDTILQLRTGISLILEKQDTDSFMFVYNSKSVKFNSVLFNDFVNEIASVAARYLRNDSSTVRHLVVDSSNLDAQDSGELINKYKDDIAKNGVILLRELHTLPSALAMALHYYCDEYNPLVKNSAIFSTLDLANCSDQKSTHAHIEKCLTKKWNSVPTDNIGPLLTRVVSVVIDVTNVF